MLHKGTTDGPRHQPFIDHSAVFSLLTSVARSVEYRRTEPRYKTTSAAIPIRIPLVPVALRAVLAPLTSVSGCTVMLVEEQSVLVMSVASLVIIKLLVTEYPASKRIVKIKLWQ
jgi:hypothetical protein